MPALLLALAASLVTKSTDFVRFVKAKDISSVVTQIIGWAAGIGVSFLLAAQNITEHVAFQGVSLAHANGAALVLLGLGIGSGGSILSDIIKALDTPNPTTPPKLIP